MVCIGDLRLDVRFSPSGRSPGGHVLQTSSNFGAGGAWDFKAWDQPVRFPRPESQTHTHVPVVAAGRQQIASALRFQE
jgi:hypothetical protein